MESEVDDDSRGGYGDFGNQIEFPSILPARKVLRVGVEEGDK